MIKNYRCPKCQNLFSEQDYYLHSTYCKVPQVKYTTQNYGIDSNTNGTINYLNNYNRNNSNNHHTVYVSNNTSNRIPNTNTNANTTITYHQQPQVQKQIFRPKTITYYNTNPNQVYNYSNTYQNQTTTYPTVTTTYVPSNYICNTCKKSIPLKDQKDHMLSHKLEQEEKDRLQAQRLQDEDYFENLPPEQIEQQRKIEEYIRRHRQNNNNNMNNEFNFDDDMNIDNSGNIGGMNITGFPNITRIRTITTNNNRGNNNDLGTGMGSPGFFENFFNGNMNINEFMNRPSSGNTFRRIVIPMGMGGFGNMDMGGMGQNDLNELIERMLHHTRENPTDAAIVSELPETKIDDINKLDNDKKNCVICMEDFKNGDKSTNLPCLHMFHTNCIQSWLKTQNTCPICKFKLTPENINNINRRS